MKIKLTFDSSKSIIGEAQTLIDRHQQDVFQFIADDFFNNYRKWTPDVIELQALDGEKVCVGARGRQVRENADSIIESTFEIDEFSAPNTFGFQCINPPYKHRYTTEQEDKSSQTKLTFRFEMFEIDIFMRPFSKLIRVAIEEGAESTVEQIKELLKPRNAQAV